MPDRPVFLTKEGRDALRAELEHLRHVRRPEVTARIQDAQEHTDITANGEFHEARNELAFIEGRVLELERILRDATVVSTHTGDRVGLGCTVVVEDETGARETFQIVGSPEARPLEGKISNESPVGRALMDKRVGDTVTAAVPSGAVTYSIVSIS
jgi:transcription elongation factor GreA